jgi:hypothetical protein
MTPLTSGFFEDWARVIISLKSARRDVVLPLWAASSKMRSIRSW